MMIGINMECFNFTCQGESHKATNKVCQDYSYSKTYENGIVVAIVCDGHGGKRYFRSHIGSQLAGEITEKNVKTFIESIDSTLFVEKPYTSSSAIATQITNASFDKENNVDKAFRQLFSSIIYEWNTKIVEHANNTPLTEEELNDMESQWVEDFNNGKSLEKVYGCTLMVCVITPTFWFAFHIGDGKCVSFDNEAKWSEPIPWDERCFLNKTTSLCDSTAIDEFRYCYQGKGEYPIAIFLGSDGVDDSFGAEENLVNFYVQIIKEIIKESKDDVIKEIESTLPQLSKIGSKDDMSLAVIYNKESLITAFPKFISWQIDSVKKSISNLNKQIQEKKARLTELESEECITRSKQIEYNYTFADVQKLYNEKTKQVKKIDILSQELYGDNYTPYMDNIGLGIEETIVEKEKPKESEQ